MESIAEQRRKLPIFRAKDKILEEITNCKTIVFISETGSGKTTQIPQYLLEAGFAHQKCIGITQPRRVAAVTIAQRVAKEVKTELGDKVGYSIRFENLTSPATKIKYLTDGMLLRESIRDKFLLDYSVIILDEVHERTLNTDILLGIVKSAQRLREEEKLLPLKIVVMSATLDCPHFCKYFNCDAYEIAGRQHNIEICQTNKQPNYVHGALCAVFKVHQEMEKGDVLVFCTGQEEIDYMVSVTKETAKLLSFDQDKIQPFALYGALPSDKQVEVFKPVDSGTRKVIFSTNIAETSITIPNIKYVIDTGMVKAKSYNSISGIDILVNQRISKEQAIQRAGRAGRESEGKCIRLYTDEEYKTFKERSEPEILRCCLSSVVLQMVAMGIGNIADFDFIDKPSKESIASAIHTLQLLDAVVEVNGLLKLTTCGEKMVVFPIDPRYSKMIIESKKYRCTDEILTIVSLLSVESIFYTKLANREQFTNARMNFEAQEGDLITMLNVYKQFKRLKGNPAWCQENFINAHNIRKCIAVRKQLSRLCEAVDIPPINCKDNKEIRKCLASGLFMNAAFMHETGIFRVVEGIDGVKIHPSSCLFKRKSVECCIYTDLVQTTGIYMRNVTDMPKELLLRLKPDYFKSKLSRLASMKPSPTTKSSSPMTSKRICDDMTQDLKKRKVD